MGAETQTQSFYELNEKRGTVQWHQKRKPMFGTEKNGHNGIRQVQEIELFILAEYFRKSSG